MDLLETYGSQLVDEPTYGPQVETDRKPWEVAWNVDRYASDGITIEVMDRWDGYNYRVVMIRLVHYYSVGSQETREFASAFEISHEDVVRNGWDNQTIIWHLERMYADIMRSSNQDIVSRSAQGWCTSPPLVNPQPMEFRVNLDRMDAEAFVQALSRTGYRGRSDTFGSFMRSQGMDENGRLLERESTPIFEIGSVEPVAMERPRFTRRPIGPAFEMGTPDPRSGPVPRREHSARTRTDGEYPTE